MDAQAKAHEIYARLEEARLGTVLAVWKDGGVSFEGLGFQGRRTKDGDREQPLVTFVAGSGLSYHQILQRLAQALRVHGLLPAEPG
jgi:hypothetical protein